MQSFLNSHFDLDVDHGADLFATPRTLLRWLRERNLISSARVGRADLERALAIRQGLRELARGGEEGDIETALSLLNDAAVGAPMELRFARGRPRVVPVKGGSVAAALGLVLGLTAQAMLDGSWSRLKICPGEDCGWAFFDHSRNQTGRWCSMSVCGGRAKARSHYRRRRGVD